MRRFPSPDRALALATALATLPLLAQAQATGGSCTGTNASANYIQGLTLDGPTPGDWTPSAMHWDSGLVWQRCVQGMAFNPDSGRCEGRAEVSKWYEWASQAPGLLPLSFSGQEGWNIAASFSSNRLRSGDWRMPYKNELLALHSACTGNPAVNAQVFPDTPVDSFATGSPLKNDAPLVWRMDLGTSPANADTAAVTAAFPIRLVRGGQPFAALPQASYATHGNTGQVTAFAPVTLEPLSGGTAAESMAWGGMRITGEGNPQLRVNAWGSWVSEAIVRSGDEVSVRLSASATAGTTASATLVLRSGQTTGTAAGASNGGDEGTVLQEITTTFSVTSVGAPAPQACTDQRVLYAAPGGASGTLGPIGPGTAGSSWSTPAALQHALALANADTDLATCYQIHLKQGLYKPGPAGNAAVHFALDRPLQLLGGYTGNPANPTERQLQAGNTVLSGDIDDNDDVNAQGITEVARLPINLAPGNQIKGTNSQRVLVIGGLNNDQGNGWFTAEAAQASYTLVEGLTLTGAMNDSGVGGGLLCNGAGAGRQCSPLLRQLRVSGNRASFGGGLYNNGQKSGISSPQIEGVTFSGNGANFGGAMGNAAAQSGTSSPDIVNSTFSGNQAGKDSYGGGGAIDTDDSSRGTGQPRIRHSTFSGNQASDGSALQGGKPEVFASIFWDHPGTLFSGLKKGSSATYSIVQGGRAGEGNLNIDPLLGPLQDNSGATPTHLPGAGSPAIDALADCSASPATDQRSSARPQGYGCDMGAVEAPASSYSAPGAPTGVSASAGNGSAVVQWSAPASNGGGAITGYIVTALPGNHTCTARPPATSCTVTGLDNDMAYTFRVVARNGAGAGAPASTSGSVVPLAPPTASAVSVTVAANSSANPIPLTLGGGAATSVAITSAASHGSAMASGTRVTYTPATGYSGTDRFAYTATNASGTSAPAMVTVTVNAPPPPPLPSPEPEPPTHTTVNTAGTFTLTQPGLPVVVGPRAAGALLVLPGAGTTPVALEVQMGGQGLRVQALPGTQLRVAQASGQGVLVLVVQQGWAQLSATQAHQPLALAGGVLLSAGVAGTRIEALPLATGVLAGSLVSLDSAVESLDARGLLAGERLQVNAQGEITALTLGTLSGLDPTHPTPGTHAGLHPGDPAPLPALDASIAFDAAPVQLQGSVARLDGEDWLQVLQAQARALGGELAPGAASSAVWTAQGTALLRMGAVTVALWPQAPVHIDTRLADGLHYLPDGQVRIVRHGLALTLSPTAADWPALAQALAALLPGQSASQGAAALRVTREGVFVLHLGGTRWALRPSLLALTDPALPACAPDGHAAPSTCAGVPRFTSPAVGTLAFANGSGLHQGLPFAFAAAGQVRALLAQALPGAQTLALLQPEGALQVTLPEGAGRWWLLPEPQVWSALLAPEMAQRVPLGQGWGLDSDGLLYLRLPQGLQRARVVPAR